MVWRYATCLLVAAAVSSALFLLMESIVGQENRPLEDDAPRFVIDFVRLRHEATLQTKDRIKPSRPDTPPPPVAPALLMPSSRDGPPVSVALAADRPAIDNDIDLSNGPSIGVGAADSDTIPLVRINPLYPPRAAERGIEGWVLVEFTISEGGAVENPRVVDAEPRGIFESAAIRAIHRWRYRPRIENGKPIRRPGIRVRLTFDLESDLDRE